MLAVGLAVLIPVTSLICLSSWLYYNERHGKLHFYDWWGKGALTKVV